MLIFSASIKFENYLKNLKMRIAASSQAVLKRLIFRDGSPLF
jgi:hypothetical protein